jgi:hypothetical protein
MKITAFGSTRGSLSRVAYAALLVAAARNVAEIAALRASRVRQPSSYAECWGRLDTTWAWPAGLRA